MTLLAADISRTWPYTPFAQSLPRDRPLPNITLPSMTPHSSLYPRHMFPTSYSTHPKYFIATNHSFLYSRYPHTRRNVSIHSAHMRSKPLSNACRHIKAHDASSPINSSFAITTFHMFCATFGVSLNSYAVYQFTCSMLFLLHSLAVKSSHMLACSIMSYSSPSSC